MSKSSNHYLGPVYIFNIPVHAHWNTLLGGIVALVFTTRITPVTWESISATIIADIVLVLIHELGHALAAKICGLKIFDIRLSAIGGECYTENTEEFLPEIFVYSGGFVAQILAFGFFVIVAEIEPPKTQEAIVFYFMFTFFNVLLLIINLLPFGNTDGANILRLVKNRLRN